MLQEVTIKNFKSIADDTIALGRVNVFIGANGCGKSNILEAVMFASLALTYRIVDADLLNINGIRVSKPLLMLSSFEGKRQKEQVEISFKYPDSVIDSIIAPVDKNNIYSIWESEYDKTNKANGIYINRNKITESLLSMLMKIESELKTATNPALKSENDWLHLTDELLASFKKMESTRKGLSDFIIYTLNTQALRGIPEFTISRKGIFGENLDVLIAELDAQETKELKNYIYTVDWLDDFFIDKHDVLKQQGYKLNQSKSVLYFKDRFMMKKNNVFSTENANEGVLHILFYLTVLISKKTSKFFAIDNIETALNPHLCRRLMKDICQLAKNHDKQVLITTHNPAILDGLNLHDDEIRLFEVKRDDNGHTKTRRIKLKPSTQEGEFKLSELWTRGFLGAISENF